MSLSNHYDEDISNILNKLKLKLSLVIIFYILDVEKMKEINKERESFCQVGGQLSRRLLHKHSL